MGGIHETGKKGWKGRWNVGEKKGETQWQFLEGHLLYKNYHDVSGTCHSNVNSIKRSLWARWQETTKTKGEQKKRDFSILQHLQVCFPSYEGSAQLFKTDAIFSQFWAVQWKEQNKFLAHGLKHRKWAEGMKMNIKIRFNIYSFKE